MAPPDRVLAMLGLAARAGVLVPGTERVREAVAGGSARFVVVAADASENTVDKLVPMLERRGVRHVRLHDRATIGEAVGRAPLSAIAVTDAGLARRLESLVAGRNEVNGAEAPRVQRRRS